MALHLPNSMWTWWTYPRAVQCGGFTYVGSVRDNALFSLDVIAADRTTNRILLTTDIDGPPGDDHNNISVVAVPGKPLIVFHTKHDIDRFFYWWVMPWNADAAPVVAAIPARIAAGWGTVAGPLNNFTQVLPDPTNNTLHMFATVTNQFQGYARSETWGADFAAQSPNANTMWLDFGSTFPPSNTASFGFCWYRQLDSDPTKCRVLLAAGYESARTVRYCEINLATGDITKSDGTVLGNLRTGVGLPISAKEVDSPLEVVFTAPAGSCLNYVTDILGGTAPEGCFGLYDLTNPDTASTYHWCQRQSGNSWLTETIVNKGPRFTTAPSTGYHGEAQMLSAGNVLLGRNPTGAGGFVNGMWTGGAWNLEKWTRTAPGVWTPTVLQTDPTNPLVRPFPVQGGGPFTYAYMRAINYTTYNNCSGELVVV